MIELSAADLYPGLLVFFRALGLFMLIPVFSGLSIPRTVRIALAGLLGLLLAPNLSTLGEMPTHWLKLTQVVAHEILAGLLMGLASRLLFFALEMAGQLISTEIGLSLSANLDPLTRSNAAPANTMLFYFGTLLFLVTGSDHACLHAFARSFEIFPPNAAFDPRTADRVIAQSDRIFVVAVQIAAPLLAVNFLVNLALAALGRAAPSLEVYSASFPIRILAGLTVFGLTFGLTAQHVLSELREIPELMLRFLR